MAPETAVQFTVKLVEATKDPVGISVTKLEILAPVETVGFVPFARK